MNWVDMDERIVDALSNKSRNRKQNDQSFVKAKQQAMNYHRA